MTQNTTRVIDNRIKWSQDQASAQAAIVTNKNVAASFSSVADAASRLGLSADQIAQLNAQMGGVAANAGTAAAAQASVTAATDTQAKSVGLLAQRYLDVKLAAEQARNAQVLSASPTDAALTGGGNLALQRGLFNARQAAIALPGVGFQSPLTIGLRGLELVAAKTGASLTGLAGAVGVVGIAVVALAVVFNKFSEGIEAAKKRLTAALSAQDAYYTALQENTTEATQKQIEQLKAARPFLEQQVAETQGALDSAFAQAQAQFGDAAARALDAAGKLPTAQLREALDEQKATLQTNIDTTTRLTQAQEEGAFKANDLRAAEEELAKAREQYLKELTGQFDDEAQLRLQLADLRRSGTSEELQAFYQRNNDEINIIRNFLIPAYESAGVATGALTDRMHDLEHANELAEASVRSYIEQREREAKATEALVDRSDAVNDSLKELRDTQAALAKAAEASAKTLQAVADAENEHAANLREIELESGDKAVELRQKLADKLVDIDAKSAERIRQQKENDNLSTEAAIARGDIAAAQQILAQQRVRAEQEKRNVEQQKQEAEDTAKEQLDAAKKQTDKLLRAEQERYDKELRQRRDAHNQALQEERAALNAEAAARATHAFTIAYWNGVVATATNNFASAAYDAAGRINQATGLLNQAARQTTTTTSRAVTPGGQNAVEAALASFYASYGGTYQLPQPGAGYANPNLFDTPSYNTRPGIYRSLVPEVHIPIADFNRMGSMGGDTLVFQIDATGSQMDEGQFRRVIEETVVPIVEKGKIDVVQRMSAVHRNQRR